MPVRGELQLLVDFDVVGAARLMLHGVDVGNDTVVESFVVRYDCVVVTIRMCGGGAQHDAGGDGQGGHGQRPVLHVVSSLSAARMRWPVGCGNSSDQLPP